MGLMLIGLYLTWDGLYQTREGLKLTNEALALNRQTIADDHKRRRLDYTMHLYDQWRDVMDKSQARMTLEKIRDGALKEDDLRKIAAGESVKGFSKEQVYEMRQHIVAILNLFEQIAVASRDNIGESEMIKTYFRGVIINNRRSLQPFIEKWKSKPNNREGWAPLDDIIDTTWKEPLPAQKSLPTKESSEQPPQ